MDKFLQSLDQIQLPKMYGRITEVVGVLVRATMPKAKMGDTCLIEREGLPHLPAEVVGFTRSEVILSPLGSMEGISPSSRVIPLRISPRVPVGRQLLGRVLNGLGEPLDSDTKGPLGTTVTYPTMNSPPNPLERTPIKEPLSCGIRCIDGPLTIGRGQRVGIFAAAGGGKSSLLGMLARNTEADVNVIGLIGERGREVREFLQDSLGEEGLARSVVVVSTSDQPSQLRLNAAYVTTAIAEWFREQGLNVVLMIDSITRYARALREIGLAAGEPPARAGYTPSMFACLPKLLERAGNSKQGSITAFYTVLVAGDDLREPVADESISILDGHIILSAELAQQFHYPAVDILPSRSRVLEKIVSKEHLELVGKLRTVLSHYRKNELLIRLGEYKVGSDKNVDFALKYIEPVNQFLKQGINERSSLSSALQGLRRIFSS